VGLVCRVLEEQGIATVCVATGRDLTALVKPPRALFEKHPLGNNFGRAGDIETQTDILRAAFAMLDSVEQGGELIDYPTTWSENFEFAPGGKVIAATA
jgi:hypothetical protein